MMKGMRLLSIIMIFAIAIFSSSCKKDDVEPVNKNVKVTLTYPDGVKAAKDVVVKVKVSGAKESAYELKTDNSGSAVFQLPMGNYEFSAIDERAKGSGTTSYKGVVTKTITDTWKETDEIKISMSESVVDVKLKLVYPTGATIKAGVDVIATDTETKKEYIKQTDDAGLLTFSLPIGSYKFMASDVRTPKNGKMTAYKGTLDQVIDAKWETNKTVQIELKAILKSQLIIKEVYTGGVLGDNGKNYSFGQYVILYNNSNEDVDLQNLCLGMSGNNSNTWKYDVKEGETERYYFKENWTPARWGFFYFPNKTILKPQKQIVIAMGGGINHSATHSNAVDLSKKEYYVNYDIEVFTQKFYYPAPASTIPTSHYLKAKKYAGVTLTAWMPPTSNPNMILFYPEGKSIDAYAGDVSDIVLYGTSAKQARKKVPLEWVVDAMESFRTGYDDKNKKRVHPKVDAGYLYMVSKKGYTVYRNVDKAATEAIEENKDKLVYNYSMGTKNEETKYGSTDPSGIDAEASIAKGAVIIYMDTNNSKKDFHLRKKSSLRK